MLIIPYPKWVWDKAEAVPVPNELLVKSSPLLGNSVATADPGMQIDTHHIFPMALFPNEHTQTIKVSQKRHEKLHEIFSKRLLSSLREETHKGKSSSSSEYYKDSLRED